MTVSEAIDRSRDYTERVKLDFDGTENDLESELNCLWRPCGGDYDSNQSESGTLDVWGWTPNTPEGDDEWRLSVTLGSAK